MASAARSALVSLSLALVVACTGGEGPGSEGAAFVAPYGESPVNADGAKGDGGSPPPDGRPASGDAAQLVDAGPPRVRFVGRFDTREPAGPWCAWPGCRIIARFTGSGVSVRLNERVEDWMLGGPSEWDVAIDGAWGPKLVLETGTHDYVLATGLGNGPHRVELYKRSEAQNGTTQFLGYTFTEGTLLPPPPPAARRLEIIGDSQPAAFGVEGVGYDDCPGHNWAARWQNFRISFGARLGEIFSADVQGTVHSGKGLVRNIWRPDPLTMGLLYPRTIPNDKTSSYDFSLFVPDVVIVMLGGNDFAIGQPEDDGPAPRAEFIDAYRKLTAAIRGNAPQAHIFLTASPSVTDEQPEGRLSRTSVLAAVDTVTAERNASGDARVHAFSPALAPLTELTGCEGHGNPAFHDRVAQELATAIRAVIGW